MAAEDKQFRNGDLGQKKSQSVTGMNKEISTIIDRKGPLNSENRLINDEVKNQRSLASIQANQNKANAKKQIRISPGKIEALKRKLHMDKVTSAIVAMLSGDRAGICVKTNDECPLPLQDFYNESLNRLSLTEYPEARTLILYEMMMTDLSRESKLQALVLAMTSTELQQLETYKVEAFLSMMASRFMALSPSFEYAYSVFSRSAAIAGNSNYLNIAMKALLIQKYPEQRAFIEQNFHR